MKAVSGAPEAARILAPLGRDAEVIARLLREDGIEASICPDLPSLTEHLAQTGFTVLTDDALIGRDIAPLAARLVEQPPWSDYPIVLLTRRGGGIERNPAALRHMQALSNVTFLERPFHPMTLVSLARTALASRRRQYQARDRLLALEQSRAEIAQAEERFKFALEAGRLGAWELDFAGGRRLSASALCKANFGVAPEAELTYERLLAILHPEERRNVYFNRDIGEVLGYPPGASGGAGADFLMQVMHPEDREPFLAAAQAAIDGASELATDTRIVAASGEERWVEVRGRAVYGDGRASRMAGVSLDITERKQAEERQHLLIRELHHRVKNTLSTVMAIVGSTARGAETIEGFYQDFTARIMSLANTHTLLTEELWQRASLHELLGKELNLYDTGEHRIQVSGPEIELPSDYAVPLGMAFHELATNAAKYGALSDGQGRLSVAWSIAEAGPPARLRLAWIEEAGPPVRPPTRTGFGTRLLERVLTAQLKAEVGVEYDPRGVRVALSFALPEGRPGSQLQALS